MKKRHKGWAHNPFAEQAHLLPSRRELRSSHGKPPPPKRTSPRSSRDDLSDEEIFAKAMSDVAPLQRRVVEPPQVEPPAPSTLSEDEEVRMALEALVKGDDSFDLYYSDEFVEGALTQVDPVVLERLREGEYAWQGYLDMHGMRVDEAKEAVGYFFDDQQRRGHRCLLLVHGRGHHSPEKVPILKRRLVGWLTRGFLRKKIMAFATARNHDGGAGALYVLLL